MRSLLFAILLLGLGSSVALAHEDEHRQAGAFGKPGESNKVSRTVAVTMNDNMRFTPSSITVKRGDTVRFEVRNDGKLKHEFVIGTMKDLKAHAQMMRMMPGMQHSDENMLSVDPGKKADLIWQFTRSGTFDFACLVPGHFEAGMRGKIAVSAPARTGK